MTATSPIERFWLAWRTLEIHLSLANLKLATHLYSTQLNLSWSRYTMGRHGGHTALFCILCTEGAVLGRAAELGSSAPLWPAALAVPLSTFLLSCLPPCELLASWKVIASFSANPQAPHQVILIFCVLLKHTCDMLTHMWYAHTHVICSHTCDMLTCVHTYDMLTHLWYAHTHVICSHTCDILTHMWYAHTCAHIWYAHTHVICSHTCDMLTHMWYAHTHVIYSHTCDMLTRVHGLARARGQHLVASSVTNPVLFFCLLFVFCFVLKQSLWASGVLPSVPPLSWNWRCMLHAQVFIWTCSFTHWAISPAPFS
jgi:hypothetical protein